MLGFGGSCSASALFLDLCSEEGALTLVAQATLVLGCLGYGLFLRLALTACFLCCDLLAALFSCLGRGAPYFLSLAGGLGLQACVKLASLFSLTSRLRLALHLGLASGLGLTRRFGVTRIGRRRGSSLIIELAFGSYSLGLFRLPRGTFSG